MTAAARSFDSFETAFANAFHEEISGEGFFVALSQSEPDPRCAALWAMVAQVERATTDALRPVASALGLTPTDEAAVLQEGHDQAPEWQALCWRDAMGRIVREYPAYLDEFTALKRRAPASAVKAAQLLIDHEIAIIDMARAELAGAPDPAAPLRAYLASLRGWSAG